MTDQTLRLELLLLSLGIISSFSGNLRLRFRSYQLIWRGPLTLLRVFPFQLSSVAQSCLTLCDPMDCSTPDFPQSLVKALSNSCPLSRWCHPTISSCHPLLLMTSVFPNIRVFSKKSTLCIRWPKYWSFSFSISPSDEYSGLVSFRIDWFDMAVQGTLMSLFQHHSSILSFTFQLSHPYMTTEKP